MAASGSCGTGIKWTLADNGTMTISGSGKISFTTQPWANYASLITSIVIEEGITTIPESCFEKITSIASVTLPSTLTTINNYAFRGCTGITQLHIPSLDYWLSVSLAGPTSSPMVPYTDSTGNCDLFINGVLATDIIIPDGTTKLLAYRFYGCKSIVSVALPDGLTTINSCVFDSCVNLKSLVIPDSVTSMSRSIDNCTALEELVLGNGLTVFPSYLLSGLTGLKRITLGDKLSDIEPIMGHWCDATSLVEVVVPETNETYTALNGIVYTKDMSTVVCVPHTKIREPIASTVTTLGSGLFYGYDITSYVIPDNVTAIGGYCFYDTNLTHIIIPETVAEIGLCAFKNCAELVSIDLSSNVTSIGYQMFYGCTKLGSIELPDCITEIGGEAFYNCDSLVNIDLPKELITIGNNCFSYCNNLTRIEIPKKVGTMLNAFSSCTSLAEVIMHGTIPPNISYHSYAGGQTFANCTSLTAIKVPVGAGEAYRTIDEWPNYASLIVESEEAGYEDDPVESEPEPSTPTLDRTSMVLGWIMGRRMFKLKNSGNIGAPVACLYNDVRLPVLPEYDKTEYQWGFIVYSSDLSIASFYVYDSEPRYKSDNSVLVDVPASRIRWHTDTELKSWGDPVAESFTLGDTITLVLSTNVPIWTNTDMLNTDGSLYLEASEPVPVYE